MKKFINKLVNPQAALLSIVIFLLGNAPEESNWIIALIIACTIHIIVAILDFIITSLEGAEVQEERKVITRNIENIELGKEVYELRGDKIVPYTPKAILALSTGVYLSIDEDFIDKYKILEFFRAAPFANIQDTNYYKAEEYYNKRNVDHVVNEFRHYTTFISYDRFFQSYDEALEARNDNIRDRIQKEVDKIDKI